jgi:hypothetical protein
MVAVPACWATATDRPKKIEATDTTARLNDIRPSLIEREHYHLTEDEPTARAFDAGLRASSIRSRHCVPRPFLRNRIWDSLGVARGQFDEMIGEARKGPFSILRDQEDFIGSTPSAAR